MKIALVAAVAGLMLAIGAVLTPWTANATHVVDINIDSVTSNPDGSITVTGTVECNLGSVASVAVFVSAVQGAVSDGPISPAGSPFSPCTGASEVYNWSVNLPGPYVKGQLLTVTATSDCCDDATNSVPLSDTVSGKLTGSGFNENAQNAANICANAGAGNGGETAADECDEADTEAGDADPGKSGGKNNAPPIPPGQAP